MVVGLECVVCRILIINQMYYYFGNKCEKNWITFQEHSHFGVMFDEYFLLGSVQFRIFEILVHDSGDLSHMVSKQIQEQHFLVFQMFFGYYFPDKRVLVAEFNIQSENDYS